MLYATTGNFEGHEVEAYLGVVFGDAVLGVNIVKDLFASIRDVVGGRSATYERELGTARDTALATMTGQAQALGADAVIGIDLDYEVLGSGGGMLMVSASGTAVRLRGGTPKVDAQQPDSQQPWPQAGPWARPAG